MIKIKKLFSSNMGRLQSEKGFTLTEVLLAAFLAGLVIVLMSTVLIESTRLSRGFEARTRDELERLRIEKSLRSLFAQAVDLTYVGDNDLNTFTGTSRFQGAIRAFDSDALWNTPPETHTLAVFWRENTVSPRPPQTAESLNSQFLKTGIYFQKPTANKWGVLYVDLGTGSNFIPDRGDFIFEGLVGLKIKNVQTYSASGDLSVPGVMGAAPQNSPVSAFDLELTYRKYLNPQDVSAFRFCPETMLTTVPACRINTPVRDIKRTLRIVLRNNLLTISPSDDIDRLPGVPVTGAQHGARPFERIHFFKPFTPGEFL